MDIDWVAPFKFAFEAGMWSLGILLCIFVVLLAAFVGYALVAAFVAAIKNARKQKNPRRRFETGNKFDVFTNK